MPWRGGALVSVTLHVTPLRSPRSLRENDSVWAGYNVRKVDRAENAENAESQTVHVTYVRHNPLAPSLETNYQLSTTP